MRLVRKKEKRGRNAPRQFVYRQREPISAKKEGKKRGKLRARFSDASVLLASKGGGKGGKGGRRGA